MYAQRLTGLLAAALVLAPAAFADHNDHPNPPNPNPGGNEVQRLSSEAESLNSQVQWSSIHWSVKDSVTRFAQEVRELVSCERGGNPSPVDHNDHPGNCGNQRQQVAQAFQPVERYLNDTMYDYPGIYQQYQRTAQAVRAVQNGGGGGGGYPPPRALRATGMLDTVNFNLSGYSQQDIDSQCVQLGRSYRIVYVRGVVVNGQRFDSGYGAYMSLNQACDIVARNAR